MQEALDNLIGRPDIEIIIVNDGSTDIGTIELLGTFTDSNVRVIHKQNGGPGSARNAGVAASVGMYLLFLDSDNRIEPGYIDKAITVLKTQPKVGVVYAMPVFIGDDVPEHDKFEVEAFSFDQLLIGNYIDMCSFVRRQAFDDSLGFNEKMKGCEDWDLWIQIATSGWHFHFIQEELFYYRVRQNSVSTTVHGANRKSIVEHISDEHHAVIYERYKYYARLYKKLLRNPFVFFGKILYSKYILGKDYRPD